MASNPKILIVDDDVDFASLLADVFSQASYNVTKSNAPKEALKLIGENDFDLMVTDLRMPEMDGFELSREARKKSPNLPIIMVSGFLEEKDRNRMQEEGIVGTYEKPLSVFTLLKNATELIEKNDQGESESISFSSTDTKEEIAEKSSFEFTALPCRSPASRKFAEKLYDARARHSNICLIAPKGTPIHAIGENFCRWLSDDNISSKLCTADECKEEDVRLFLETARDSGAKDAVLFVNGLEEMDPNQQKALSRATRKGGMIENWDGHLRFVLTLHSDVETLYQKGGLSDELYLSIGTSELSVPPLRECPEDIRYLAENLQNEEGRPYHWAPEALQELCLEEWPGNHASLKKTLHNLIKIVEGSEIQQKDVGKALHVQNNSEMSKAAKRQISLKEMLITQRDSYIQGALELAENDVHAVAALLNVPVDLIEKIRK